MKAPLVETTRLRLRAHRLEDFDSCKALWAEPEVVRYIMGVPCRPEETWSRLLRYRGHWEMLGFGYWILEEKNTATFLGEVGFANYKRDMRPSLEDRPEAGWVLSASAHGMGYGREAVSGMLAWADQQLDASSTVCIIHPNHKASIRLALSCGYSHRQKAVYKGTATDIYERDRPQKI